MKNHLEIIALRYLFLVLIIGTSIISFGQTDNPFSLENDKKIRREIREKSFVSLSNSDIDSLISQYNSLSEIESKCELIEKIDHVRNARIIGFLESIVSSDSSIQIKESVCQSLANLQSESSIPILRSLLRDNSTYVKISASLALLSMGDTVCLKEFGIICYSPNSKYCYSCNLGFLLAENDESIKFFYYSLKNSPNVFCRVEAAINLAILKQPNSAIPDLLSFLKDTDPDVRMAAIRGFAYIGDDKSLELIEKMIDDPNNRVKNYATRILNKFGSSQ